MTLSFSKLLAKYSQNSSHSVYVSSYKSPVGECVAAADDDYLYLVSFEDSKNLEKKIETLSQELSCTFVEKKNDILEKFEEELSNYFNGKSRKFSIPLKTFGSEFQREVWKKLQDIPYGSTQTYGDLAKAMGRAPSHSRAVGAACGANSHLLVIPCHRLVASGSKGGFTSGVDRKEWLIEHEKKYVELC